jgi:amino acid transporter
MGNSLVAVEQAAIPRLRRVLGLWDLIFYGIVVIQPMAAVPLFGIGQKLSNGHMVTTILISMLAMMLTASSYGRMASVYPVAGSAYTYVGRSLNAHLGFVTGWLIFLDYLIVPVTGIIYSSLTVQRVLTPFLPQLPPRLMFALLASFFAAATTALNLRGIRTAAKANIGLLVVMSVVIILFMLLAIHRLFHLQGWTGVFSWEPFYDVRTFHIQSIATATSFAALTYIGFDSVTTLAEDVHNPRRNILLATIIVCAFTGVLSGMQIYLGQLVWPDWRSFPNLETAFMDVTRRVGGPLLFEAIAVILVASNFGAALTGQIGAARLLFSMGRDNVLPKSVFAYLDPKMKNPTYNILIIGLLAFMGAMVLSYELAAECLNFGAFLGFMGVNLAAFREFYLRRKGGPERRFFVDAVVPILGFLFCLAIWASLPWPAKVAGSCWLVTGVAYDAIQTRGFRREPTILDLGDAC